MNTDWKGSISLHEARQEASNGNASYGRKNSKAYLREFGEEYVGQMEGEMGAVGI